MTGRIGWATAAVGASGSTALAAGGGRQTRLWLVRAALAGAALAGIAMLAVTGLSSPSWRHARAVATQPRLESHRLAGLAGDLAAAASVSIGRSERSFWPVRDGASLMSRGGAIDSTFTAAGARVRAPGGTLELSLAAVGRGGHSRRVSAAAPQAADSEVLYRHGSVTEFYRGGPYGLEQGFTLRRRPSAGREPLVLTLSLGGSLAGRQVGPRVLFSTRAGATALQYGQLRALDAKGDQLPARISVSNGTLQLRIDDRNAVYPLRIDPFIQQGEKLTAKSPEEVGAGHFGESVALSADGKTAVVGTPFDNKGVGAVWAFTRTATSEPFTQQGEKLVAKSPEEVGEGKFGDSVALDSKGETALIGAPGDSTGVGAVWVFTRSGFTWTQQGAKLVAKSGEESGEGRFGEGVALAPEGGNTALIGGPGDSLGVGAAWAFTRSASTWTQQGTKLVAKSGEEIGEGLFGASAALDSEKGNIALLGAPGDSGKTGAAWVFTRASEKWTQQGGKLVAGENASKEPEEVGAGQFGMSVALSAEKASPPTALMGAPFDGGATFTGATWVFTRSGSTWTKQGTKLLAKSGEEIGSGFFGDSVAVSSPGNTALIGASGDHKNVGAAWVFTRSSSVWSQHGEKLTASGETGEGLFGESVGLDAKGETALFGGGGDNTKVGAAWAFATQAAKPAVVTEPATEVTGSSATLNAKVNPEGQSVTNCHFEYGPTTAYGTSVSCASLPGSGEFLVAVSASVTGLKSSVTHFRISATNASGTTVGQDRQFTATPPTVTTGAASAVTQSTAMLNGTVNPNGGEISECDFEYGTTTAYGSTAHCSSLPAPGESPVAVSGSVTGLAANTTYHFRLSATSTGGTRTGEDATFTTLPEPPVVATSAASLVTQTSATLNARVNPNGGLVSECSFEYGTSTSYGSSAPCTPSPGSGTSAVAVSAAVSGLTPNTAYHFRISATNSGGTSKGLDRTFTTANPHYYRNGAKVGSTPITDIAWGTITLRNVRGGIANSFVTCHTADAGTLFNPAGGGAGEGSTQVLATFQCESELVCPFGMSAALVAEALPWHDILTEEVSGVIRQEILGVKVLIECLVGQKVEAELRFLTGATEKGLRPKIAEGTEALHPSFFEFGEGSGELEEEGSGGLIARKVEGAVKLLGYNAEELLSMKDP